MEDEAAEISRKIKDEQWWEKKKFKKTGEYSSKTNILLIWVSETVGREIVRILKEKLSKTIYYWFIKCQSWIIGYFQINILLNLI